METILAKALGQDITQLATGEKQRLLSRFLGRVAHEVRNPLSSLDIHIQLLDEDLRELAPETREKLGGRLEIIRGELKRLDTIVQQFLRLSGPSELNLESVDLLKIIQTVCELLRPEANIRNIALETDLPSAAPAVMGDAVQISQALMNLIVNALQAVDKEGRVEVKLAVSDSTAALVVSDTGPGLPNGKVADIFEPYFTTKSEGNGLGLWIAQQIAIAHHGQIEARNGAAGGAIFTIQLPIKLAT